MEQIKDRYQFIIGFAAIIISLSAFKDELKKINIDYEIISFSASDYLFSLIIAFVIVVHLYSIPYIFKDSKHANSKILNILENGSYSLFLLMMLSPIFLSLVYLLKLIVNILTLNEEVSKLVISIFSVVIGALLGFFSRNIIANLKRIKKEEEQSQLRDKEVKAIEISNKLFKNGFYNQSFLELFKLLEVALFKKLRLKDLVFRKGDFSQMLTIARRFNIISEDESQKLNKIRLIRNEISQKLF
jgi:hypothetical protein